MTSLYSELRKSGCLERSSLILVILLVISHTCLSATTFTAITATDGTAGTGTVTVPINTASDATPGADITTEAGTATNAAGGTATNAVGGTATNAPAETATNAPAETATNAAGGTATNAPAGTATNAAEDAATNAATATNAPQGTAVGTNAAEDATTNAGPATNAPQGTAAGTNAAEEASTNAPGGGITNAPEAGVTTPDAQGNGNTNAPAIDPIQPIVCLLCEAASIEECTAANTTCVSQTGTCWGAVNATSNEARFGCEALDVTKTCMDKFPAVEFASETCEFCCDSIDNCDQAELYKAQDCLALMDENSGVSVVASAFSILCVLFLQVL